MICYGSLSKCVHLNKDVIFFEIEQCLMHANLKGIVSCHFMCVNH